VGLAWLLVSESGIVENLPADEWFAALRRRSSRMESGDGAALPAGGRDEQRALPPAMGGQKGRAEEPGHDGETPAHVLVGMARATGERISDYAGVAGDRASRMGGELLATIERHPLLFGAIGLVSGAALATLLPLGKRGGSRAAQQPHSTDG
jgi:hypothetical protein